MLRDHHALHLVRALADLENLLVAIEAGDRELVHEAVAAVDLERLVDDAVRELARVELRHRRLERERATSVLEPRRLEDELPSRLDLDRHVGELERDGLERADRASELLPLLCVGEGEVVRALREPDAHRRHGDAPTVEDLEKLVEALAARPEQVPVRDRAVGERELARVRGLPAELVERLGDRVAGRAVLDNEVRDLVLTRTSGDGDAPR